MTPQEETRLRETLLQALGLVGWTPPGGITQEPGPDPILLVELRRDEGMRRKPYFDTATPPRSTIGVGRNLTDVGLSDDEVDYLLANDIRRAQAGLDKALPWWRSLDPVRQRVLTNMAFNLGINGLLTFKNTLALIEAGNYAAAAEAMGKSLWAKQVGARAVRLAAMMETGQ